MFLLRHPVHIVIRNQSVRDGLGALIFCVFFRCDTSGQGGRRIENTPPVVDHMSLQERRGDRVRQAARRIFKAVDGYGLSRVDFFVTKDGEVIFNEINTMPGFTAISMYPMLFEAAGIPKPEMVTKLIEHGLKRYEA